MMLKPWFHRAWAVAAGSEHSSGIGFNFCGLNGLELLRASHNAHGFGKGSESVQAYPHMLARIFFLEGRFSVSRWLADAAGASIANNLCRTSCCTFSCAESAATSKSLAAHQVLVRATRCFLATVLMPNQNETILKCACLSGFFLRFEALRLVH